MWIAAAAASLHPQGCGEEAGRRGVQWELWNRDWNLVNNPIFCVKFVGDRCIWPSKRCRSWGQMVLGSIFPTLKISFEYFSLFEMCTNTNSNISSVGEGIVWFGYDLPVKFACKPLILVPFVSDSFWPSHSSPLRFGQKQNNICFPPASQPFPRPTQFLLIFWELFPRSIISHSEEERRALSGMAVVLSSDCDRGTDSSVRERGPRRYRKVKWQARGMKRLLNKACGWPIEMSCTGLPLIRESLLSLTEPLGPDTPDWSVAPAPTRASVCVSTLGQHVCARLRSMNEPRKWDKRRVIATPITVKLPEKRLY